MKQPEALTDVIPREIFHALVTSSRHLENKNHLMQWLGDQNRLQSGQVPFESRIIREIIEKYLLCTSEKYLGWTLFPYIDINGNLRDVKAMNFNPITGKRVQELFQAKYIGNELLNYRSANLKRCLFGEHLSKENNKPALIFESESAAIHASPFYPDYNCMATGGQHAYRLDDPNQMKIFSEREIILVPDLEAHDDWTP